MARSINALERQEVATVDSALFNPDVVFLLAALLSARDLCQVSLTCKTLGGKRANAVDGLSLVEEAARRLFECASEWERACLPRYPDEGWVELYHHLLMLRSKLSFDQLAGNYIQHGEEESTIRTIPGQNWFSSALCSNHVMRSGKHFAVFTGLKDFFDIGVVRPVQIKLSDFGAGLPIFFREVFSPGMQRFWEYLLGQRTARWTDSNVHCCNITKAMAVQSFWYDWRSDKPGVSIDGLQSNTPIGLLLDLDDGTLSIYQNDQRLATLKNGLSGEYCWFATVGGVSQSISIEASQPSRFITMSCVPVVDDGAEVCANCGAIASDTVKLKSCTACRLVKYCGVDCQRAHRKQHKKACKKRAAELKDEELHSQGRERKLECFV